MILSQNCQLQTSKAVTKNIHIHELWFLHSACHLLVINMCMKFYEYTYLEQFQSHRADALLTRNC